MKKWSAALLVAAIFISWLWLQSKKPSELATSPSESTIASVPSAATTTATVASSSPADEKPNDPRSPAERMFPEGQVIAVFCEDDPKNDRYTLIKTMQTSMREPFVRVEEVYSGDGTHLVEAAAMVANQVMVERPSDLSETEFVKALDAAGATALKKIQTDNFLVSFLMDTKEPKAIEAYLARLNKLLKTPVHSAPNYIRTVN